MNSSASRMVANLGSVPGNTAGVITTLYGSLLPGVRMTRPEM